MDLLLAIIELFSLGIRAEAEALRVIVNICFFSGEGGQFGPKFQVEGDVLTNHSSCQKLDELIFHTV